MRVLLAAVIALGALTYNAHATEILASCSASTPRVGANLEIDDANGCTASFTIGEARQVSTLLAPSQAFAGNLGLRVRGPNALWTQYEGVFVAGVLVAGRATSTFTLQPGTWQLELYVNDGSSSPQSLHKTGAGTFAGRISG